MPPTYANGRIFPVHVKLSYRIVSYLQRVIRSTSCLVLGWGFRGRRI